MRAVIIDNYDSFTFNLYQAWCQVNGVPPVVFRHDQLALSELRRLDFDCVIISPGPGHPANNRDFGVCTDVLEHLNVPTLGVCLGSQGLGLAYGATIGHAPVVMHGRLSSIAHNGDALFKGIPQGFRAVRYHSLVVQKPLPQNLIKIAWTADNILMGIRHREKPLWGVQFHPESICTDYGMTILENFRAISEESSRKRQDKRQIEPTIGPTSLLPSSRLSTPHPTNLRLRYRCLEGDWDAETVFANMYGSSANAFWLDSNVHHTGVSRFSFMGDDSGPMSYTISHDVRLSQVTVSDNRGHKAVNADLFEFIRQRLACQVQTDSEIPFDFTGGLVGYLGYEMKAACGSKNQHHSIHPDAAFILADRYIAFDHDTGKTYLVAVTRNSVDDSCDAWFDNVEHTLQGLSPMHPPDLTDDELSYELALSTEGYLEDIDECLRMIKEGESYQLCLTNKVHCALSVDPFSYYRVLRRLNPAPYAAYLRFDDVVVASSSPERFLKIDRHRIVETRPIKGTLRRGGPGEDDARLKDALRGSQKNRSENLMIVDLMRNDLGIVCKPGSVYVPELMAVESYATVHQMVSTIRGKLRDDVDLVDCVRHAFPGGSMTGAPKLRSMEILDGLETEARGVYSGALGFLGYNGTADLSMVIRTAVIDDDKVTIGTGGGIVALSDPDEEVEEMLLKAEALLEALRRTPKKQHDQRTQTE
jgi:para-aminobenzoate synthetase